MEYLCRLTKTPTGGIILDPFMGAGTTGMACLKNGRDFIGIEQDKGYYEIASNRIKHIKKEQKLSNVKAKSPQPAKTVNIDDIINKIICGDNVSELSKLPDNCIDLTVTSPPYDNLRSYNGHIRGNQKYNGYSFDFESLARQLFRVTKEGGVVVWITGDGTVGGSKTLSSFRQALYFQEQTA